MNPVQELPQGLGKKVKALPTMLSECSSVLHSFSNLEAFIDFALDAILGIVDASSGSFFVWDEYSKKLVLKTVRGPGADRIESTTIELREGIGGLIADKGFPVLVKDIRTDVRFRAVNRNYFYHSYSFLAVPLVVGNKLLGLINITERETKQPFADEDLERAQTFAQHIAIAYENVKTANRLRKENEELHQTVSDLREKLKQGEPLVALGKLASHLGHELANPLDAIRRFVNLALDQVGEESLAREYLLKAKRGIRRSVQVIRGLLELSGATVKIRVRNRELHSLIDQVITAFRQDPAFERIAIEKQFCDRPLLIEDCGLQTVFKNLFENACYAMNGSGPITVVTRVKDGQGVVSIRDVGCGVPARLRTHIFEPFFTTKDNGQGTGIGLTICREIVQRCGGGISFESNENKGTEFIITLPLSH